MSSRSLEDLQPEVARRYRIAAVGYARRYPAPDYPEVKPNHTFRTKEQQEALYAQGRTAPGRRVTNARGGQSLHNFYPAWAIDVWFEWESGGADWRWEHFDRFARFMKPLGFTWGGDWKWRDGAHFEPENFSWRDAKSGAVPTFPELPRWAEEIAEELEGGGEPPAEVLPMEPAPAGPLPVDSVGASLSIPARPFIEPPPKPASSSTTVWTNAVVAALASVVAVVRDLWHLIEEHVTPFSLLVLILVIAVVNIGLRAKTREPIRWGGGGGPL